MGSLLGLFTLQIAFAYARTVGSRHVAKDNVAGAVLWGFIIQALWLTTTTWSVKAIIEGNYWMAVAYLLGGTIGSYLAMIKDIR